MSVLWHHMTPMSGTSFWGSRDDIGPDLLSKPGPHCPYELPLCRNVSRVVIDVRSNSRIGPILRPKASCAKSETCVHRRALKVPRHARQRGTRPRTGHHLGTGPIDRVLLLRQNGRSPGTPYGAKSSGQFRLVNASASAGSAQRSTVPCCCSTHPITERPPCSR